MFSSTFSENYSKNVYAHDDIWAIPENRLEAIPTDLLLNSSCQVHAGGNSNDKDCVAEYNIPTQIFGSPELQQRLKRLLQQYSHIFSRVLSKEPAKITPFRLTVDTEKWDKPKTAPREGDTTSLEHE